MGLEFEEWYEEKYLERRKERQNKLECLSVKVQVK